MTSPQPGFRPPAPQPPPPPGLRYASEPWTRSSTDRVVAGVCGGLGRRLNVDPVILRVVVVVLAFFAGAGIVLYAAAWLLMPLDRTNHSVLSDAFASTSADRVRSVLTAGALLAVVAVAALIALDGGFVPGLLIGLVVVAILMVVRRDEAIATSGPSPYGPPAGTAPAAMPYHQASTSATAPPTVGTASGNEPTVVADSANEPPVVTDPGTDTEPTGTIPQPSSGWSPTPGAPTFWEPPGGPLPPMTYQPGPPTPAPRRERSYLGVLTVSAMITVFGVMGIIDLSGVAVPVAGYLVAALAVVAGGLVLGAWVGRSRGLIALGVVLGVAIGPAVLVDAVAGTEWREWSNADDVRLALQSPDQLAEVYEYGGGSLRLDLTDIDFDGEQLATLIDMGAGEVIVTVPSDVDVVVDGAVVAGDLTLFDRHSSGFDVSDAITDLGADGAGGGQLDLSIDLGLGNVEVRRATS